MAQLIVKVVDENDLWFVVIGTARLGPLNSGLQAVFVADAIAEFARTQGYQAVVQLPENAPTRGPHLH